MNNLKNNTSKIFLLFFGLIIFCNSIAADKNRIGNTQKLSPRTITNINSDWKFQLGDFTGVEKVGFADGDWKRIGLPHSFSRPYFLSPDFYTGYGWYRKNIDLGNMIDNRCYSIEFEGVFQVKKSGEKGKK